MKWIINVIKKYREYRSKDSVYNCKYYKEYGCAHVDGMLCDFDNCSTRKEHELWILENGLDIPYNDRYYKSKKI